jgi:hypothetical protein
MPVWISSAMNSVPYLRHSASAPGRNSSVGRLMPLPWIGSTMKAATWRDDSACSSAARSLKGVDVQPGSLAHPLRATPGHWVLLKVSDTGLVHFKDCKDLISLMFNGTQVVKQDSQTISPTGGTTATEFHISKKTAWPKGKYTVEVSLNGVSAGTKDLEVK